MPLIANGGGGGRPTTPSQYWPAGRAAAWQQAQPPQRALPPWERGPLTTGGQPAPFMGGPWVADWVKPREPSIGVGGGVGLPGSG